MDPGLAVGAVGGDVDLPDQVGQPGVPDRPGRRRPGFPVVVARGGHAERVAGLADADSVSLELGHEVVPVFWGHHLLDRCSRLAEDLVLLLHPGYLEQFVESMWLLLRGE